MALWRAGRDRAVGSCGGEMDPNERAVARRQNEEKK